MKTVKLASLFLLIALISCDQENNKPLQVTGKHTDSALFTLVSPAQSGLTFNNALTEGVNTNILMYEYFYNGGGVATADFNGDGLIDVYLTSNMQENKLFLNKGNLTFYDVTKISGVGGRPGPWKTGVSVADVNGDKRMDIFVCYSGMVRPENRVNQLFINQGNNEQHVPTFVESSEAYGLNSPAFTNQAYFFDFDKDQDLDLLLLNHNPVNLPILNEVSTASMLKKDDPERGVRMLRQDKGKFKDITVNAGVNGSALTYGLGAGIADVNNDHWPDIYISNDYSVPDYLYVNNKNGTFTNVLQQAMGHTSQFSMGNDVADIDNDGFPEIFTLDMLPEDNHRQKLLMAPDNYAKFDLNVRLGFYYQYMRNMLHRNNGNGTFSEIGQLSGISNTDWSWAALFADYDNDGLKDLLVTNGYVRDYTNLDFIKYMDNYTKSRGRLVREEVLGIIEHMPASNVVNYIFSNEGNLSFKNRTVEWGMASPSNSNGAAYADLDNDGDLDIVINNINQNAFLYRNNAEKKGRRSLAIRLEGKGMNTQGIGARVTLWEQNRMQVLEQMPARGYLSAVSPVLHFGLGNDGKADSLLVEWPNGNTEMIRSNIGDTIVIREANARSVLKRQNYRDQIFKMIKSPIATVGRTIAVNDFKRQPLLLSQFSHGTKRVVKGDVNNDGRDDIYLSGGNGDAARLYMQQANHSFVQKAVADFEKDKVFLDADAVFADLNGDGFKDLYVATGGYHDFQKDDEALQDRIYLNDKLGNFHRAEGWLPPMRGSKGCVAVADFNDDGRMDVFVGGRVVPGRYPETPESYLLINNGTSLVDQTDALAPQLRKIGMVTDALFMDVNDDKHMDLVVAGEWMRLTAMVNENGKLVDRTTTHFRDSYAGWWNVLDTADVNNDGLTDLIAGNLGLNSQCKASVSQPAEMFFEDFDHNGSIDPLFSFYVKGRRYPYITRDELLDQIGSLRSRFTDYQSYADAALEDIVTPQNLNEARHLVANDFQTRVFLATSERTYQPISLPLEAQYAPVYAIATLDFDDDGNKDLLLCGNNSKTKIKLGKYDANFGVLLKGDGKGHFAYVDQRHSGLALRGDVRSIVVMGDTFLFGINERPLTAYRISPGIEAGDVIANLGQ